VWCKLGHRLPSGCDQNWEARTPLSQCLGHQQAPTISIFHRCFPEQSREDATGSQAQSSAGRWCYYSYLPLTLEPNQALVSSREAAAPCHSCHSAFRQKRKRAFMQSSSSFFQETVTEVPLSYDSLLSMLNIVYSSLTLKTNCSLPQKSSKPGQGSTAAQLAGLKQQAQLASQDTEKASIINIQVEFRHYYRKTHVLLDLTLS